MILSITENDPEREYRQLQELLASRVAGLVISPTTAIKESSKRLLGGVPVVELHRASGIDAPGVFSDDEQVLAESVLHLASHGHRVIGYLGTPVALSNGAARLRGVRRGAELAGIDPGAMPMSLVEPTQENGYRGAMELLGRPERPTALIVGGGSLSIGAARGVRASRRRLPEELSLVVYGDPNWFALSDPPLTAVVVEYAELARRAAALLLAQLDGPGEPPAAHLIRPELVVAGSTGPPSSQARTG
jgi:LacI family transcriptional regulator